MLLFVFGCAKCDLIAKEAYEGKVLTVCVACKDGVDDFDLLLLCIVILLTVLFCCVLVSVGMRECQNSCHLLVIFYAN